MSGRYGSATEWTSGRREHALCQAEREVDVETSVKSRDLVDVIYICERGW